MQMSDGERLIVVMLAEVMETLKLNGQIDPKLVKSLAIDNNGWALKRTYPGIFESVSPSPEVVKETTNILWMWSIIEHSISKLTGTEANEVKNWHYTKWDGFDGNHDPHYGVARTMIVDLGEFQHSRNGVNLNSHSQSSLPRYRRMYEKFDSYIQTGKASPLSFEALRDLCS